MMELLSDPNAWASLLTLTVLEIVLGIDNIIFLSIVTSVLPEKQQPLARRIGLMLALGMRVVLLSMVVWLATLTGTLFTAWGYEISWRDLIMIGGGLFLIWKGTAEVHHEMEDDPEEIAQKKKASFAFIVLQIVMLDLVFSLDSVITAVGMTNDLPIMIAAVVIAIGIMMFASEPVSAFVNRHPTVKMLALSFILLVGVALVADGLDFHIPRGFLYAAIAFSMSVECLNLMAAKAREKRKAGSSS